MSETKDNAMALDRGAGDPSLEGATLLFQMAPGAIVPWLYTDTADEISGYQTSAWIGTTLMMSPVYDVIGPDACKLLQSVCVNDFTKLKYTGLRHAVLCNDKGQVITDGVVIRIAEDRYRTYWLSPVLKYYVETSDLDVRGEDISGQEYFIQVQGEKSLEILEDAFECDLHDIKFAKHRTADMQGHEVRVIRLGMSGNLAYEIHGPIADYDYVYRRVIASGNKFCAKRLGNRSYNLFNHTEAGFPNIALHYPLPYYESSAEMKAWFDENIMTGFGNNNRVLTGSSTDLQEHFVTPYDLGWEFLIKFNHDFVGREALEKLAEERPRTVTTLEWNPEDVAKVFANNITPGSEKSDDITADSDFEVLKNVYTFTSRYHADEVYAGGRKVGITSGRIISHTYGSMISLAFIDPAVVEEGNEVTVLWGTPGMKQFEIRAKVARYPYNGDFVRNEDRDVEDIPHRF